ncbi:GMC family oxidoreductase [soil metagenome]
MRELRGSNLKIVVLEAGSGSGPGSLPVVAKATRHGQRVTLGRREGFGGTAHAWGVQVEGHHGRYARFAAPSPLDFSPKGPFDGWPLGRDELQPFYERANHLYDLPSFDPPPQPDPQRYIDRLPMPASDVWLTFSPYVDRNQFVASATSLYSSPAVDLYVNAVVRELEAPPDGQSVRLRVATQRDQLSIRARNVVLAAGGIENARLLLSAAGASFAGPGNEHGHVGRTFMEHPFLRLGLLVPNDPEWNERASAFDIRMVDGTPVIGSLSLPDETRRTSALLGLGAFLVPRPAVHASPAIGSLWHVRQSFRDRRTPQPRDLAAIVRSPRTLLRFVRDQRAKRLYRFHEGHGGWSSAARLDRLPIFDVFALVEQLPQEQNRVVFDDAVDRFGRRLPRLEWKWHQHDLTSLARTHEILGELFVQHGVGTLRRFAPTDETAPAWDPAHHHMGTTRMSRDPKHGVVDANCRVHGTDNLFVAGSSVFPTGTGYANPTLTIVALAIRLADHLRTNSGNPSGSRMADAVPPSQA